MNIYLFDYIILFSLTLFTLLTQYKMCQSVYLKMEIHLKVCT